MTLLLAHPEAEDLGRFVEGTLDEPERSSIVQHIADCDDCRMLVVDAAEFAEPAKVEHHSNWWMGVAASLMLVAAISGLSYRHFRDPLADVKRDSRKVKDGPLKTRLSGFGFGPHHEKRGGEEDEDIQLSLIKGNAVELRELRGNDAKTLHAKGIGYLLGDDDKKASIAPLQAAAAADQNNATYQSDLAVALITAARGDPQMLERALAACDRALSIDPDSSDALFNRAFALQALKRPEALAAYERYLKVDPTSPWAEEARTNLELLRP